MNEEKKGDDAPRLRLFVDTGEYMRDHQMRFRCGSRKTPPCDWSTAPIIYSLDRSDEREIENGRKSYDPHHEPLIFRSLHASSKEPIRQDRVGRYYSFIPQEAKDHHCLSHCRPGFDGLMDSTRTKKHCTVDRNQAHCLCTMYNVTTRISKQ